MPSPELERSLKVKEYLESSLGIKWLLLALVLFSTSMVIADGVVTPAISGYFIISKPYMLLICSFSAYHLRMKHEMGILMLDICYLFSYLVIAYHELISHTFAEHSEVNCSYVCFQRAEGRNI